MLVANCLAADETTLIGGKFLIDVEKTIKNLQDQEDTDGNFQITIEDNGPKVSEMVGTSPGQRADVYFIRSFPFRLPLRTATTERRFEGIISFPIYTRKCFSPNNMDRHTSFSIKRESTRTP
jgi:neutral trehalase